METYRIENLSFKYPARETDALKNIRFQANPGEFIVICGKSGCGKSTLLRHLKPALTPHGSRAGRILFEGIEINQIELREQTAKIGYVLQSPDNQIVTDKVWHELAFGLESLGRSSDEIRLKVAEMASFFGIESWFHKNVEELSGGQKQLMNLAAIMTMQPSVLLLDEPTSQLDPIAASDFIKTLGKINQELGTTIILSEHRLEEVLPLADRMLVMDTGRIILDAPPREGGKWLKNTGHDMFIAMPSPMRIYAGIPNELDCPLTVREGRKWLDEICAHTPIKLLGNNIKAAAKLTANQPAYTLKEVWFRYDKNAPNVVRNLNIQIESGSFYAILGGNGVGKTTALSLLAGLNEPNRGNIFVKGRKFKDIPREERYHGLIGMLPQNPQGLFVKKTVEQDLYEMFAGLKVKKDIQKQKVEQVIKICGLEGLLPYHPYDLSGGEQQRAALAKILLLEPEILLLDEPTKAIDNHFKQELAAILNQLKADGKTIIMVSHDVEFCAQYADRCAMFFDGFIIAEGDPRSFFTGNSFYTTTANRMARHKIPWALTADDVIAALKDDNSQAHNACRPLGIYEQEKPSSYTTDFALDIDLNGAVTAIPQEIFIHPEDTATIEEPIEKEKYTTPLPNQVPVNERKLSQRTIASIFVILLLIPFTIYFGIYYLGDRKYYFISMMIIFETMIPFFMIFEQRKPQARELVVLAVLCAAGMAGRMVFFMVPQFKPVVAIVIISGLCFGGESGFLIGAVTGFISNFFFGQGPWTPWQMFAFGIIGFLAGILFRKGFLRRNTVTLCIYGALATLIIYGGIMNTYTVFTYQDKPTLSMILFTVISGLPLDLIHTAATVIFLAIFAKPMLNILDRIKIKYGLIE